MLDRLRKRFESLLTRGAPLVDEVPPTGDVEMRPENSTAQASEAEALLLARQEAQKRESRLILTEQIHNRAAALQNEIRTSLLYDIHRLLEDEVKNKSLHDFSLQVTLDTAFTAKLDDAIEGHIRGMFQRLEIEFRDEPEAPPLFPGKDHFVAELKLYRDSILRKHLLEQVEVLALPTSARVFPRHGELRKSSRSVSRSTGTPVATLWTSSSDRSRWSFSSSGREGIRVSSSVIRDRLLAAQYRNGYRLLEDRSVPSTPRSPICI